MNIKYYEDKKFIVSCFENTNECEKYKIQNIVRIEKDDIKCSCGNTFNKETAYMQHQRFYPKGILGKSVVKAKCTLVFNTCAECKKITCYAYVGCGKGVKEVSENKYELILTK